MLNYAFNAYIGAREARPYFLSEILQRPAFGILADHPFAHFLIEDLVKGPRNINFLGREPGYGQALANLCPDIPPYEGLTGIPRAEVFERPKTQKNRDIDILVALDFRTELPSPNYFIDGIESLGLGISSPFGANLYRSLLNNYEDYPWDIFENLLRGEFGSTFQDITKNVKDRVLLAKCLNGMDLNVRAQRRTRSLSLLEHAANKHKLKIVVLGDRNNAVDKRDTLDFIGKQPFSEYINLLTRSKCSFCINPTYPQVLNGRVLNAISSGCSVISDFNPTISGLLSEQHGVWVLENNSSDEEILVNAVNTPQDSINHGIEKIELLLAQATFEDQIGAAFMANYENVSTGAPSRRYT